MESIALMEPSAINTRVSGTKELQLDAARAGYN